MKYRTQLCLLLAFAISSMANDIAGQYKIIVLDSSNNPIAEAEIKYKPFGKQCGYNIAYTDAEGSLILLDTPPLSIIVSANGYKTKYDTVLSSGNFGYNLTSNFGLIKPVILRPKNAMFVSDIHFQNVISAQRIDAMAAVTLEDVLKNDVNVQIVQDPQLGAGLKLRGIGGQHVKILMDGVPMIGRNDGNIDLAQINLNNIESIEITQGPMSVIYGTDALGGIINLITRIPQKNEKQIKVGQFMASTGAYNSYASIDIGKKKQLFNFNATRYLFDGLEDKNGSRVQVWKPKRQYIYGGNYTQYFNKNLKHSLKANYFNEYLINRGSPNISPFQAIAFDEYFTTNRYALSSELGFKASKYGISGNLINGYNYYKRNRNQVVKNLIDLTEITAPNANAQDTQIFNNFNSRLVAKKHFNNFFSTIFGYDYLLEQGKSARLSQNPMMQEFAVFYAMQLTYKKWNLEQGLRASANNQFKVPIIPNFMIGYQIKKNIKLFGSWGRGFRSPSLKERFLDFIDQSHNVTGNPNLRSEQSNAINSGISVEKDFDKSSIYFDMSGFYNHITDLMALVATDNSGTAFRYQNIDNASTKGINIRLNFAQKSFNISSAIGIIGTKQSSDSFFNQDQFLYQPTAQLNGSYQIKKIKTTLNFFNKFNGAMPNYIQQNNTIKLQYSTPFMLTDIGIMRKFAHDKLSVNILVNNLLNVTNIQNTANIGGAHSNGNNTASVAIGRFFSININYTLK